MVVTPGRCSVNHVITVLRGDADPLTFVQTYWSHYSPIPAAAAEVTVFAVAFVLVSMHTA